MPPLISEVTAYVDLARLIFSHITLMRKDTVTFDHRSLISFSLTLYRALAAAVLNSSKNIRYS